MPAVDRHRVDGLASQPRDATESSFSGPGEDSRLNWAIASGGETPAPVEPAPPNAPQRRPDHRQERCDLESAYSQRGWICPNPSLLGRQRLHRLSAEHYRAVRAVLSDAATLRGPGLEGTRVKS